MTVISTKSITGVTSITSPQSDDAVTLHTNDTTQRVSVTTGGMNVTGVVTATSFSGNITGTVTGTASGNPTLANGSNNRVITATGANALTGEASLTFDGTRLNVGGTGVSQNRTVNIGSDSEANLAIETHNTSASETANIRFYRSRGTAASPTTLVDNDVISNLLFYGHDGTDYANPAGMIRVECDGTVAGNQMPGAMSFHTNGGSTSATERLRITGVGSFGINNSDPKYPMHFKNAMSSSPDWIHMEVTGSNATGGGGGIAFDTSASNSDSNNSLFLATVSGERSASGNGSNSLVFKTSKAGAAGDGGTTSAPRTAMVITEDRNVGIGTYTVAAQSGFTHSSGATLVINGFGSNSNWNGQIRLGASSGFLIDHNASSTTTTTLRNLYGATNAAALTKIESGLITLHTGTSYAERVRITSDDVTTFGNSSPPAWQTGGGYYNIQLGNAAYFRSDTDTSGNFLSFGVNAYRDSSGWKFKQDGRATQVNHTSGDIVFNVSNSGSAAGAITFAEALRIHATGQMNVASQPSFAIRTTDANSFGTSGSHYALSYASPIPIFTSGNTTTEHHVGSVLTYHDYVAGSNTGRYVKFTAPVAGNYLFGINAECNVAADDWVGFGFEINNTGTHNSTLERLVAWTHNQSAEDGTAQARRRSFQASCLIRLAASDYVVPYQQSSGTSTMQNTFRVWGMLVN